MDNTLSQAIADYIQQRKEAKLEPLQKALNKILEKSEDPVEIAEAKAVYAEESAPIEASFTASVWLSDAAKRAKQISLATHAAKFTHSDAKASSMLVSDQLSESNYLVTASLNKKAIDAVGNAAALDVARLLKLECDGESLITQLQQGHVDALRSFTNDEQQLKEWKDGFSQALGDTKLSSHTLSKQLYFPLIGEDKTSVDYHLLCPLFSSALAHELYHEVRRSRYGDSKEIRDAHKIDKYHEKLDERFFNLAVQNFGGSKPQNISQLNNERHGQTFLLNCAPPQWKRIASPPVSSSSLFGRELSFKTAALIREFRLFLENLREDEKNVHIRRQRDNAYLLPIIDTVLNHAAVIQMMKDHAGWSNSDECKMKPNHALWLDVYNTDEAFQKHREKGDWLVLIATDFASWLTHKLKSNKEKYILGDIEHAYFSKLFLHQLKHFERSTPKLGEL
ncbi:MULTISPECIES: type I-F CRISPR-associated protein Csy1 [Aliivibrio]|uniref:Type I-F CRISPR-associated protein Csy1 n=1 Tax=Aliivibrio finisterrensis TaxID=511998 RepID=A0A4Q5KW80_9GAMM|nr:MULTISPECIES: type I-F CRISPR-associated protein Csy1 [Aliivibrio]MDD9179336.1 type I-F CRISPR-associated protein Csy1 [Aliivibrio sp. A6]RYU51395.1 type I-F CRISPR-associated protein Csy1 [Aliivibrio finisterrensis]RYU52575.1 type I-F CRISPR-associated protein Csy1 [Aliivibrio finisterrensis]RYU58105.1 type I-F CRISPR-associated protein Csy1 [Aliivibrio finisterrensis]RYU64593.1 type I-F CRISPR-associated protein Csy1 [Aliivibrio finisterrensis]